MPVYLGIDWSQAAHAACFLKHAGARIGRVTLPHTPTGFAKRDAVRITRGTTTKACWVGFETAHTLLIDWLWVRGYTQGFVIPPNAVQRARERYRQRGASTDQSDAYVIADMVRTDQAQLQPWHPATPLTRQVRANVSVWLHLTQESTRLAHRLRAVLVR